MKEDLLKIINHYGYRHQLKKFDEETFELIEAIFQYESQKEACENIGCSRIHIDKCKEHMEEEIADVMVLLGQFKHYYDLNDERIKNIMEQKRKRQLERMKEE